MLLYTIARYLHFIAIFGVIAALIIKNTAIKTLISEEDAINLAKVNLFFNLSLILTCIGGLVLWFWVGRPSNFYTQNPLFMTKLILFTLIFLLSLFTSNFFRKHREPKKESIEVPTPIVLLLRLQLTILAVLPLIAFLITRGVGFGY
tara:strand:- start:135 stop:575 length:441 start_codon:yes stop_codon:yes gene_type:complete